MRSDRGGVAIVVLAFAAIVGVAMVAVGALASLYGARVHASTAADAAALAAAVGTYPAAGADDPVLEAARYARMNGATLAECDCSLDRTLAVRQVRVIVEMKVSVPVFGVIPIRAGANAEFDPILWLGR